VTDTLLIQVQDANGIRARGTFIIPIGSPPSITTTSPLPGATQGNAYSDTLAATGGTAPYTWSLTGQTGSNGWSLSSAGVLTGTPVVVQTNTLTVEVEDSAGNFSVPANLAITVSAGGAGLAGGGSTLSANFPSGFASSGGLISFAFECDLVGSQINLTDTGASHAAGGAWYTTKQNISAFTTNFTLQMPISGVNPSIQGTAFVVQNTSAGDGLAADANLAGIGAFSGQTPATNSVAVVFNLNPNSQQAYPTGGTANQVGLFINSGPVGQFVPANDLNPCGINFYTGHVFAGVITYDGTILTLVLTDTTTNAQARVSWPINIAACVGASTAFVGFTGGQAVGTSGTDFNNWLLTWQFYNGATTYARLATPTFNPVAGQYSGTQSVAISGGPGAIYYTVNGVQPTSASSLYTGPISVASSEVIQAVQIQSGSTDSYVATANYQIGTANQINLASGFAVNDGMILTGYARRNGSAIQLCDTTGNTAANAWYAAPVNILALNTTFTIQIASGAQGMTFIIQNQPSTASDASFLAVTGGPIATGGSSNGLGYAVQAGGTTGAYGFLSSIAVKFDVFSGNTTGLYTNGAVPGNGGTSVSPVTLSSGNPITCALSYNNATTTLSMTLTDTVTGHTFSTSFSVNIPSIIGGNTGYAGFGGGSGGGARANILVNNWKL